MYHHHELDINSVSINTFCIIGLTDTEFGKTRGSAAFTAQFPNVLPDLERNLGEALSCILETEMKLAFGNLWMEVVSYIVLLDILIIERFECPWYFIAINTCAKSSRSLISLLSVHF